MIESMNSIRELNVDPLKVKKHSINTREKYSNELSYSSIHRSIEDNVEDVLTPQQCNGKIENVEKNRYNRGQIWLLIALAYGNFWIAACVSLQAPFFPKEAESKGATPTQYGLIFGIYELVICVTSPLFGKLIARISPNFLCITGLFIAGLSTLLFGIIDRAPYGAAFISLCFLIRIIEGVSAAAFMTASYTMMAAEFPDRVATTFSLLETFFGLGLILGPTVGGALYQWGGYMLPFTLLGLFLFLGGFVTVAFLPKSGQITERKSGNLIKFISDTGIILDALSIVTSLNFIGFNAATLEPHLRQFDLSPIVMGCIFVIMGGIYAFTTPIWGKLCDSGYDAKMISAFGSLLCCVGFVFIGPFPLFAFEAKLWIIIVSLVFIGFGISAKLVTAFVNALYDSVNRRHFPNDLTTYGLVSALFFSSCSIGAFVGPTLGGFLLEKIGYRNGTIVILIIDILLMISMFIYIIWRKCEKTSNSQIDSQELFEESQHLLNRRQNYDSGSTYSRI